MTTFNHGKTPAGNNPLYDELVQRLAGLGQVVDMQVDQQVDRMEHTHFGDPNKTFIRGPVTTSVRLDVVLDPHWRPGNPSPHHEALLMHVKEQDRELQRLKALEKELLDNVQLPAEDLLVPEPERVVKRVATKVPQPKKKV